jgi:hypothetical protein
VLGYLFFSLVFWFLISDTRREDGGHEALRSVVIGLNHFSNLDSFGSSWTELKILQSKGMKSLVCVLIYKPINDVMSML